MKPASLFVFICLAIFSLSAKAGEVTIKVEKFPASTEAFIALRDEIAQTPEGGAVMFVIAMKGYADDEKTGTEWITIALDRAKLQASSKGYKGFKPHSSWDYFLEKLSQNKHWPFSYIDGTVPEKGYQAQAPYQFTLSRNKYSEIAEDQVKVFINCSGAATPRPVTLKKNNRGLWKVTEASSLFVGMKPPGPPADDDL